MEPRYLSLIIIYHEGQNSIICMLTIDSECDGFCEGSSYSSSSHFTCVHSVVQFQPSTMYCEVKLLLSHISKKLLSTVI